MALKHGMLHQVLKFYQDSSFDDLGLTLTFFYGKVKYGKMLINWISWKVLNVLAKNGIKSCLNEYTKIYE